MYDFLLSKSLPKPTLYILPHASLLILIFLLKFTRLILFFFHVFSSSSFSLSVSFFPLLMPSLSHLYIYPPPHPALLGLPLVPPLPVFLHFPILFIGSSYFSPTSSCSYPSSFSFFALLLLVFSSFSPFYYIFFFITITILCLLLFLLLLLLLLLL